MSRTPALDSIGRDVRCRARDSSPAMEAFMLRNAERKRKAQEGEARCEALMSRVKEAKRALKKIDRTPSNGRASNAEHSVKQAKASYGLAINNLSSQSSYEDWMGRAEAAQREAEECVEAIERDARELRPY